MTKSADYDVEAKGAADSVAVADGRAGRAPDVGESAATVHNVAARASDVSGSGISSATCSRRSGSIRIGHIGVG